MPENKLIHITRNYKITSKKLQEALSPLPKMISNFFVWTYAQVATSYLNTSEGGRLAWQIGAINGAVWIAWQIPVYIP